MTATFVGLFFLWVFTVALYLFERGERIYHQRQAQRYVRQWDEATWH